MLTCKTISPQRAVNYFVKGYYLGDNSRWSGKGAAKLKLSGEVDNETKFANVVLGYSPDGRRKLAGKNLASDKRRAGVDCTFSAPKSVSLTALVGGDDRLIEAHRRAVEKTLAVIEERYSHTRVRDGVYRNIVKTGNLVVAEFDHIETRELDPHLHTHCLIMNMTEVKRGKWYSHHNEAIFENKKFLGTLYQHYLAQGVEELGYEIQSKGKGQFEIQGYKQEDLEAFSKRRQQILEQVGEHSSWFTKEKAWDRSRKKKQVIHPDDLKAHWREEAQLLGIEFVVPSIKTASSSEPEANAYEKRKLTYNSAPDGSFLNRQSIDEAIAHCSERHEAFKQEDLETFILAEHRSVDLATLDQEIASHPELIYIPYEKGVRYTTQKAIFRELNTIKLMQDGKETVGAIANSETASEYLSSLSLTDGQYMAISTALTSSDQFIAWQGVAGAGKTYALRHFTEIATKNGFSVRGFAPSAEAAKILGEEVSIDSETVASLLHSQKSDGDFKQQQIWIVDEAGLLSAKAANQLVQRATEQKARVIFVGDTRQLSAVEAGNPFKSLQQAGIKTAFMDESLRQRVEHLQVAVDAISRGEITTGFNVLDSNGCIQSFDGQEEKIKAIVADYLAISPDERQKTLVLAGTNWERLQITEQIREKLKDEGRLGESVDVNQLKAKDLTAIQMKFAHNFDVGDVVMPTKSYKRRSLEKGLFYLIVAKGKDTVTLRSPDGQELTVDLGFEKAVYSQLSLEVAVGDLLKWTKNDRANERRNGQEFRVLDIDQERLTATIIYNDGKEEAIDLSKPLNLDHALVTTTYSSQGKTADRVLVSADLTMGKESFYVAVSRVKYDLKLYTTDKEQLLEKAERSRAKENPSDFWRNKALVEAQRSLSEHSIDLTENVPSQEPLPPQSHLGISYLEIDVSDETKEEGGIPQERGYLPENGYSEIVLPSLTLIPQPSLDNYSQEIYDNESKSDEIEQLSDLEMPIVDLDTKEFSIPRIGEDNPTPEQLQEKLTLEIAPILKRILDFHDIQHITLGDYQVDWLEYDQMIVLAQKDSLGFKAISQFRDDRWISFPLEPNLSEVDRDYLQKALQDTLDSPKAQQRRLNRITYKKMKSSIISANPSLSDWQVDVAIAQKIILDGLTTKSDYAQSGKNVLFESDQVRKCYHKFPKDQYLQKTSDYITEVYNQAVDIINERNRTRQREKVLEKPQLEIE